MADERLRIAHPLRRGTTTISRIRSLHSKWLYGAVSRRLAESNRCKASEHHVHVNAPRRGHAPLNSRLDRRGLRVRLSWVAAVAALTVAVPAGAATVDTLHRREHRQVRSLHRHLGTIRFFYRHPRLARTEAGRRALRVARVWVPVIRRELAETRAQLRPLFGVPSWWLPGALCVHSHESTDWHLVNPPYSGGLQFMDSTWASVGGRGRAADASPAEQLYRAWLLWRSQGWSPWPSTSRACGLR